MIRRALVLSPTPTHPADHGNRGRVRQTTAFLAAQGYAVDFVLYPMDADFCDAIPVEMERMHAAWGGLVAIVPPGIALHAPPLGRHHAIDDWWDPALDAHLAFLCRRREYDLMWVNYAFLSRAFSHAPRGCLRVLDTHDVLAGRRELFERHGALPEFFQTTCEQEAIALARADIVVAIKESEAAHFAALTDRRVVTLPYLGAAPPAAVPLASGEGKAAGPLRVGFIGADNAVNARNLRQFLRRLERYRGVFLPDLVVVVAGNVCRHLTAAPGRVELLGRVDDLGAFYGAVDLVVAPLAFSTGLKIKVAEALARGMPVVATANAFDGFAPQDPYHALSDIDAVCAAVVALAADRARLAALAAATRRSAAAARAAEARGLATLADLLEGRRRHLVFVTDVAFWRRASLLEERAWQSVAYLAHLMPVTVLCVGAATADGATLGTPPSSALPRRVVTEAVACLDEVPAALERLGDAARVSACWVSLAAPPAAVSVRDGRVFRDLWPAVASGVARAPRRLREIVLDDGAAVAATPLRHLPSGVHWPAEGGAARLVLVIVEGEDRPALVAALRRACPGRFAVLRTASLATDPRVVTTLAALPRPAAIVTIEAGPIARELAASLAGCAGAAVFHLGGAAYPLLLGATLVTNLAQHARAVAAWLRDGGADAASERSPDAGWSVAWAALARDGECHAAAA